MYTCTPVSPLIIIQYDQLNGKTTVSETPTPATAQTWNYNRVSRRKKKKNRPRLDDTRTWNDFNFY